MAFLSECEQSFSKASDIISEQKSNLSLNIVGGKRVLDHQCQ